MEKRSVVYSINYFKKSVTGPFVVLRLKMRTSGRNGGVTDNPSLSGKKPMETFIPGILRVPLLTGSVLSGLDRVAREKCRHIAMVLFLIMIFWSFTFAQEGSESFLGDLAPILNVIHEAQGFPMDYMHRGELSVVEWRDRGRAEVQRVFAYHAPKSSKSTDYFPPPDSLGGWRSLTNPMEIRQKTGINTAKLDEVFEYIQGDTKNGGLLVLKDGWLVYEKYFGKGDHEATANLASCGKSFTSVLIGILIAQHPELFPDGLDQKIFTPKYLPAEAFPLEDPLMSEIKLGQLLSFTAGIRGNNPVYVYGKPDSINPVGPDGWYAMVDKYALGKEEGIMYRRSFFSARKLWCKPGGGYSYSTASMHIASIMLRKISGMELQDFIDKHIGKELGWGRWGFAYQNQPLITHTPGGGGIVLRPTDMLRFGYLLLQEGKWNDKQIIPVDYVHRCSRETSYNPHYPYSFQFNVNSGGFYSGLPRDAFWKIGSGDHCLYIVPSLNLVVWKLGGRDDEYDPKDTGIPVNPEALKNRDNRDGWKRVERDENTITRTLELVIESIERK